MAQNEFDDCPKCGVGKMKPTGGAASSMDPNTNKETGFERDYKCDNCGYPDDGVAKVAGINEDLNVADPIVATLKYSDSSGEGDTSSSISNKDDQQ